MATYLATVQIGRYVEHDYAGTPVPMRAVAPADVGDGFEAAFGRQPEMMAAFVEPVRALPLRVLHRRGHRPTTSRSRSSRRDSRPSAATSRATTGTRSGWSPTSWRTSGSATR